MIVSNLATSRSLHLLSLQIKWSKERVGPLFLPYGILSIHLVLNSKLRLGKCSSIACRVAYVQSELFNIARPLRHQEPRWRLL